MPYHLQTKTNEPFRPPATAGLPICDSAFAIGRPLIFAARAAGLGECGDEAYRSLRAGAYGIDLTAGRGSERRGIMQAQKAMDRAGSACISLFRHVTDPRSTHVLDRIRPA
nr:unnamed protein product [Digitaria exilis]